VLLLSDAYLELREEQETEKERKAKRFLQISRRLPLELKMLLVRRVYLSEYPFFLSHQTEASLRRALSFPFY